MKNLFVGLCILASTFCVWGIQDLSFLTNRTGLVSYGLRNIGPVAVSMGSEALPSEQKWFTEWTTHEGEPTVRALAKTVGSIKFKKPTSTTEAEISVWGEFYSRFQFQDTELPISPIFTAGASGKPIYDPDLGVWKFDKGTLAELTLSSRIFIDAPGVKYAALVTTNRYGHYLSRRLDVVSNIGFWFESDMCGSGLLVFNGWEKQPDGTKKFMEYVFELWGDGKRREPTMVEISLLLKDGGDTRDYGLNPSLLDHWIYTWTATDYSWGSKDGDYPNITYGKVPLLIAKFDRVREIVIDVQSIAQKPEAYHLQNLTTGKEKIVKVPPTSMYGVSTEVEPGVYHILPLGLEMTTDWWRIEQYINYGYGVNVGKVTTENN